MDPWFLSMLRSQEACTILLNDNCQFNNIYGPHPLSLPTNNLYPKLKYRYRKIYRDLDFTEISVDITEKI